MAIKLLNRDAKLLENLKAPLPKQRDKALQEIYRQHSGLIRTFCQQNQGSEADAQDLVQDTLIAFYEQVCKNQYQGNASIRTYLYSIARNLWHKRLAQRVRGPMRLNDQHEHIPVQDPMLRKIEDQEKRQVVLDLVNQLGQQCKELLQAYYIERYPMESIRERFNLGSAQAAKNKKHRCMRRLMEMVGRNPKVAQTLAEVR